MAPPFILMESRSSGGGIIIDQDDRVVLHADKTTRESADNGKINFFDKNLLFQGETVPKCHLGVKEKGTTIYVVSDNA